MLTFKGDRMQRRRNESEQKNIKFTGSEITLAAKLLDKLSSSLEIVYYCMEHGEKSAVVVILMSAKEIDLQEVLTKEKRETDILIEIDHDESMFALICQDTHIDGGYHFAERLLENTKEAKGNQIYCSAIEVRTTRDDIRYIILNLTEMYVKSKREAISGKILFKTLN